MILGIDISTYFEEERINHPSYFVNGQKVDPIQFMVDQGIRYLRTRIWNRPYDDEGHPYLAGTADLDNYIKLAKLCQGYGFKFVADFHYSDFWADPGKQTCPKDWLNLPFEKVEENVYKFTKESLLKIKEAGLDTEFVQIGNEITNGMIWPYGKLDESTDPRGNYGNLCRLLKAGIRGAKEAYPNIKIIIHLERSYDQYIYSEYFSHLNKYGVKYDIIGMSYYPYWHGTFEQFFANVNMCQKTFNKDVMVMELGYSFTLEDYITSGSQAQLVINENNVSEMLKTLPEPISPEGQANFVKRFLKLAKENSVKGVFYWEPFWVPGDGICWASKEGQAYIHEEGKSTRNEWCNQCLFDYSANALPALFEFNVKNIK